MANSNCLEGLRCPECGSEEPLKIEVKVMATVYDSGVDETSGDTEWNETSYCECGECTYHGIVKNFRKEG